MPAGTPSTYQLIFINYNHQSFDSHFKSLTVFLLFFNIFEKIYKKIKKILTLLPSAEDSCVSGIAK